MLFESYSEAEYRLSGSYITYNGRFCQVHSVSSMIDGYLLRLLPLILTEEERLSTDTRGPSSAEDCPEGGRFSCGFLFVRPDDPGLNEFEPAPIGYVVAGGRLFYCQRVPTRSIYLGLTRAALSFLETSFIPDGAGDVPLSYGSLPDFSWAQIAEAVERDYSKSPTIQLSPTTNVNLISPSWAVTQWTAGAGIALFQNTAVGLSTNAGAGEHTIHLKPEWAFLARQEPTPGVIFSEEQGLI